MAGAYTGGASLNAFFDAMLGLRSQRLQEELAKQEQQNRMMEMGQRAASQIGGALVGAAQQRQQDTAANAIMNQMRDETGAAIPRAGAVNTPWSDKVAAQRDTGYKTGGVAELKMRMQAAQTMQGMLAQKALTDQRIIRKAQIAESMASEPYQKSNRNITAYLTGQEAHMNAISTAIENEDPDAYKNAVQSLNTRYESLLTTNPKTKVPPPDIPPFVTKAQRKAIQAAQQNLSQLRAAPPAEGSWLESMGSKIGLGGLMPGMTAKEAIAAQQQDISSKEAAMKALPGAQEYFSKTPGATVTPGAGAMTGNRAVGQVVGGRVVGSKYINPSTNEVLIWDGSKLVKPE